MTRPRAKQQRLFGELPPLPKMVITKDRQKLYTGHGYWRLRTNADGGPYIDIDFRPLFEPATERFVSIAMLFVVWRARTSSASSLRNIVAALCRAVRLWRTQVTSQIDWSTLDLGMFQTLLSHGLRSTGIGGNDFAHVRALYRWGSHVAKLEDFDPILALELKDIRAPGNLKGQKVLSSDPEEGPFSPEEVELIDQAIREGSHPHPLWRRRKHGTMAVVDRVPCRPRP